MKNLKVTIRLDRGVASILSNNPLDGLLAHLYFQKLKREGNFNGDFAQDLPFLEKDEEGFYHISYPEYRVEGIENRSLVKTFDIKTFEKRFEREKLKKMHRNSGSGPWRAHLTTMELSYVREMRFWLRGDRRVIEELLSTLTHIGKKTSNGLGAVSRIIIEETGRDESVVSPEGKLRRHVPANSRYAPGAGALKYMPLTHPYWDQGREELCRIPEVERSVPLLSPGEDHPALDPQKMIAEKFGYKRNFHPITDKRKFKWVENNEKYRCRMCGRIHPEGYLDPERKLIGGNSNDLYTYVFPRSPFLCSYCQYNMGHYMRKLQKDLDRVYGDMGGVIVTEKGVTEINTLANDKSELYDILLSPPKEPFILIGKEYAGTSLVNGTHRAKPTLDAALIAYNYGAMTYYVDPRAVFRALDDWQKITEEATRLKIKFSDDLLFNNLKSEEYQLWYSPKLLGNEWFTARLTEFLSEYDEGTRKVAKTIARRWLKEKKKLAKQKG
jgi:hypothetical protein